MNIEKRKGLLITAQTCQTFFEEIVDALKNDKHWGDFFSRCLSEECVNPRLGVIKSTVAFGRCCRTRKAGSVFYTIKVNDMFFSPGMNTEWEMLRNTLVHELVHTLPECFNHGPAFQAWGARLNKKFGLNISTRAGKENSKKFETAQFGTTRNVFVCPVCGEFNLFSKTTRNVRWAAQGTKVWSCGCQRGLPNRAGLWLVRYNGRDLLEPICPKGEEEKRDEWMKKHVPEDAKEIVWTPEKLSKEFWWKNDQSEDDNTPVVEPLVLTIEEPEEYVALMKAERRKKRQQSRKRIPVEQLSLF